MLMLFGIDFQLKKMVGNKLKIIENICNITPRIQNLITDTFNIPVKKLKDRDNEIFNKILKSLDFEKCKAIRGDSK